MTKRSTRLSTVALVWLWLLPAVARDITRNARIVADPANAVEAAAARDLADYLQRLTGRELEVESPDAPAADRYTIAVGANAYTAALAPELEGLAPDGFVIRSQPDRLLIRGVDGRATQFGVNYFLQKYGGVRWYLPLPNELGTVVPERDGIDLDRFTDRQEPSFTIRELAVDKTWFRRNLGPARRWFVHHNMHADVFPMHRYYDAHPEYYALIGGRREGVPGWVQPCTSNPDVLRVFTDAAVQYFNRHPDAYLRPMGLNDGQAYCQCAACLASGATVSDRLYAFYDKIVQGLQAKHPGKKVGVLVYAGIRDLPSPEVRAAIDLGQLAGGLPWDRTDWFVAKARAEHKRRIREWSAELDRFFLWDWFTCRSDSVPTMNVRVLSELLKFAHGLGNCDGMYNETGPDLVLHGPHVWVLAQLLWDVERDVERLLDDFCRGMFGQGGPWMKRYYDRVQKVWWRQESGEVVLWGNHAASMDLFRAADMRRLRRCLDKARRAVVAPAARARLELVGGLFEAFDTVWRHSSSARAAVRLPTIAGERDAVRAERLLRDLLADESALRAYRDGLAAGDAPEWVQEYAPLRWELQAPWVVSALVEYRLAQNQPERLLEFCRTVAAGHEASATGWLLAAFGGVPDPRSLLDGANRVLNPRLERTGPEPNGLHMYDWTHDDRCPAAWYRWHPDRGTHFFAAEDADARAGIAYGIRGENGYDCYQQILPAAPGERYLVSARIKPHLVTGSATAELRIRYWDENRKWSPGAADYALPAGIANDRWVRLLGTFMVPADARYVVIGLWGAGFGDTGRDWALFDDVRLVRVPDQRPGATDAEEQP